MPAIVRERCREGRPHSPDGTIAFKNLDPYNDTQVSWCRTCRQPLSRFRIEAEPGERVGGWSQWTSKPYVIQELIP